MSLFQQLFYEVGRYFGQETRKSRIAITGQFVEVAPRRQVAQVSAIERNRVYDTLSVPNEPLSEKVRSSTSGMSRPRTRNAFQLLKSFKRETMPKREKRPLVFLAYTAGKRFSRAPSPPLKFPFPSSRTTGIKLSISFGYSLRIPPPRPLCPRVLFAASLGEKNQIHPASDARNVSP